MSKTHKNDQKTIFECFTYFKNLKLGFYKSVEKKSLIRDHKSIIQARIYLNSFLEAVYLYL